MDGKDFTGTITPTEARITIFEDVLGFTQADLAGITLGYNRGRTDDQTLKKIQNKSAFRPASGIAQGAFFLKCWRP